MVISALPFSSVFSDDAALKPLIYFHTCAPEALMGKLYHISKQTKDANLNALIDWV